MALETDSTNNPQNKAPIRILPYSRIVGQERIKLALEIAYVAPQRLGGVLISGQRGTGKSTAVRAFAQMAYGNLPVTIPINATEDRVVGGWDIDQLMRGEDKWQPGLLEDANGNLLYVDEVNLLDDHIVNIILDVASTSVLEVQREGRNQQEKNVSFTLVGTMNPEEGGLRPQLLDRFALMVSVKAESEDLKRIQILNNVLKFDDVLTDAQSEWWQKAQAENSVILKKLNVARKQFTKVQISDEMIELCIKLSKGFEVQGNRSDYALVIAARAYAALQNKTSITKDCLKAVAQLALHHRRQERGQDDWLSTDDQKLEELLKP